MLENGHCFNDVMNCSHTEVLVVLFLYMFVMYSTLAVLYISGAGLHGTLGVLYSSVSVQNHSVAVQSS